MAFNNLLLALALTVLWPLVLMGLLAGAEWVERRTLNGGEAAPRGLRPALSAPPEPAQADAGVPTASWPAAGRGAPGGSPDGPPGRGAFGGDEGAERERVVARRAFGGGGRHLRRAGGGRHERRG
jgi:hypothetical protein